LYLPSDDSILLADCLKEYHGNIALDVGLGSGIIAETLCNNFEYVVGSDIVFDTLESYKELGFRYLKTDNKSSKHCNGFELVCTDVASAFRNNIFDLVVSNPPYLPDDYGYEERRTRINDRTIYGGATGIELTLWIVRTCISLLRREGSLVIIVSSLSNLSQLDQLTNQLDLNMRKKAEKKLFFETISAIEIKSKFTKKR
jgi:release factor glutamine methyltransferase